MYSASVAFLRVRGINRDIKKKKHLLSKQLLNLARPCLHKLFKVSLISISKLKSVTFYFCKLNVYNLLE